ncbi:MAG: hypothetical protein CMN55_12880 [Sneathiella sp.]|jgi:hypothetical protein|uniref:hypothetical protein n=1 Tax=Sneathiella sp. TaxID=1964365 RepID=UPI000C4D96AD|nr:hypothetical protein [Sneathiella sp.]MAL79987.1 hypothetical protein [Sneathiella sp.]
MPFLRKITSSISVILFTGMMAHAAPAADNDKFDVVGFKLGMTTDEAQQTLRDYGADEASISISRVAFTYSDGVNHNHKTEDFIYRISAGKPVLNQDGKRQEDSIILYFSPPPQGGRLVGLQRLLNNEIDPITANEFRAAVIGKYGEPQGTNFAAINWKFGGGTQNCVSNDTKGMGISLPATSRNQSILDLVYANSGTGYLLDRFRIGRVKSLDQCANMLEYTIAAQGDMPATRVQATMIDVQSWVKAELAAGEEVEKLRKAAVEKRMGGGKKPAL